MKTIIEQRLVITANGKEILNAKELQVVSESTCYLTIKKDIGHTCLDKSELNQISITQFDAAGETCFYINRYGYEPSIDFYSDAIAQLEALIAEHTGLEIEGEAV